MVKEWLRWIEQHPHSVMILSLLWVLTLLIGLTWGVSRVQQQLQLHGQLALQEAGITADQVSMNFTWRDATLSSTSLSKEEMDRAAAILSGVDGVHRVAYTVPSAVKADNIAAAPTAPVDHRPLPVEPIEVADVFRNVNVTRAIRPKREALAYAWDPPATSEPAPAEIVEPPQPVNRVDHSTRETSFQQQLDRAMDYQKAQFHPGSLRWTPDMIHSLQQLVQVLRQHPREVIEVIGYTDTPGNKYQRHHMSAQRAYEVRRFLVYQGIHPQRVYIRAYSHEPEISGERPSPLIQVLAMGGNQ